MPPTTPTSHQIESTSTPGMYMVPVRGYDNFLAVSKFAEYLDSVSGALQDTEYCMKRAKIMAKHSRQVVAIFWEFAELALCFRLHLRP